MWFALCDDANFFIRIPQGEVDPRQGFDTMIYAYEIIDLHGFGGSQLVDYGG